MDNEERRLDKITVTRRFQNVKRNDRNAVTGLVLGIIDRQFSEPLGEILVQKISSAYNLSKKSQLEALIISLEDETGSGLLGNPNFQRTKVKNDPKSGDIKLGSSVLHVARRIIRNVQKDPS